MEHKPISHEHLALEDTLSLLGELEHARYHALRSAHVAEKKEDKMHYLVTAARAQRARRKVQAKLEEIGETDWCLVKSGQRLRQLNYELMDGDTETFNELEELVDSINSHALHQDMSGCKSCSADKDAV